MPLPNVKGSQNKGKKKFKTDHPEKAADKNGSDVLGKNGADTENDPSVDTSDDPKKELSTVSDDEMKNVSGDENGKTDESPTDFNQNEDAKSGSENDAQNNGNDHKDKVAVNTEIEKETDAEKDDGSGVLLICGGTNWDLVGRKELPKSCKANSQGRNLWGPHSWKQDVRIKEIISSCTACHSVIITENGQALTFGRNDKGQLGVGDTNTRFEPIIVDVLKNIKIKSAATGKGHTLFLSEDGVVYAVGDNKMGQLGIGSQSSNVLTPTKVCTSSIIRFASTAKTETRSFYSRI